MVSTCDPRDLGEEADDIKKSRKTGCGRSKSIQLA